MAIVKLFANKSAIVAKITREHASATRQSQNTTVNVYALDAAIHLAEGVLQWDRQVRRSCTSGFWNLYFVRFRHRGGRLARAHGQCTRSARRRRMAATDRGERITDHTIPGTVLKQLDIRPPFRFVRADKDSPIVDDAKKNSVEPEVILDVYRDSTRHGVDANAKACKARAFIAQCASAIQ